MNDLEREIRRTKFIFFLLLFMVAIVSYLYGLEKGATIEMQPFTTVLVRPSLGECGF